MNQRVFDNLRLIRLLMLPVLALALGACATLRTDVVKTATQALPPDHDTPTTRYIAREVAAHPQQSGFRLLVDNTDALLSRIVLADHAQRSIDLQYYIFHNDPTGRLIAQRLLTAADRGVRVRILLDDLDITKEDHLLDALDAHPNIEVRLFNPFHYRNRSLLSKGSQLLLEGRRLNRRMHNKSFIVDNVVAIIGGRNIGDEYFDVSDDLNFRDLDVTMIGPVVRQTSAMFDAYWNCDAAFPVTAYRQAQATPQDLAKLRISLARDARDFAASDYVQALSDELPLGVTGDKPGKWLWGKARLISDSPDKIDPSRDDDPSLRINHQVKAMLDSAHDEILMLSPYFIPGDSGVRYLDGLGKRGVDVKLLTNSLEATDEMIVYAVYAHYRRDLLEGGLDLYELRSLRDAPNAISSGGSSSGVSLHAKALVVDRHKVFIGSMNMDPRSRVLNTEMGVIVDSPTLAGKVVHYFTQAIDPHRAFHVVLEPAGAPPSSQKVRWIARDGNKAVSYDHDPGVSAPRRFALFLIRLLPIEGLL